MTLCTCGEKTNKFVDSFSSVRALTSSNQLLLHKPKTRLKQRGDRAFAESATHLWDNLPIFISTQLRRYTFKSLLKAHLFSLAVWHPLKGLHFMVCFYFDSILLLSSFIYCRLMLCIAFNFFWISV